MQQRNLGRSGLRVSNLVFGTNNFGGRLDVEGSRQVLHKALDLGVTAFDTSDVYPAARLLAQTASGEGSAGGDGAYGASETILGQILGPRRRDVVLSSKFGMPMDDAETLKGGSRRYMMRAVEDSLRRLKTDWLDLYQLHMPDPLTPLEETLRGMEDLVVQGKVRYIGLSNQPAWGLTHAAGITRALNLSPVVSTQAEYSLLVRGHEADLIPAIQTVGISLLAFFPLASGLLSGKYRRGEPPPADARFAKMRLMGDRYLTPANFDKVERIEAVAKACGRSLIDLAFGWVLSKPFVGAVLSGATSPAQVEQNVAAASWVPPADVLDALEKAIGSA